MNKVHEHSVVGIAYRLLTDSGELIEETGKEDPFLFLMGVEAVVPGLEAALIGQEVGWQVNVPLAPKDAYGELDEALVGEVPRSQFGFEDTLVRGMRFQAQVGSSHRLVTVLAVNGDTVTVDANHEMAGKTLKFVVEVVSCRDATDEEISHRHVHEDGSCSHDHQHGHGGCCGGHGHGDDGEHCCGGHGHHEEGECCGGHGHDHEDGEGCGCRHGH